MPATFEPKDTGAMALTLGTGPFGHFPAGTFNRDMPESAGLIYFEHSPRRMRAMFGGETIVDSRHAMLLHEHGHLPVYYFPEDEVRMDLLVPTDHHTTCPWKGEASYWSVQVGDRIAENAVWTYPDPLEDAPPLAGHVALYWDKMDEWLEEDEPALGHARDPYHRVDILQTSRHVKVSVDGELVAESNSPLVIYETGLPPRWYFRPDEVREQLLESSDSQSRCAYKGFASYFSVGDEDDVAWYYPEPTLDAQRVKGHIAFFNERVDIEVDGELQERPTTQWSRR
jgi:uncharacterized protein (DUF427 family)